MTDTNIASSRRNFLIAASGASAAAIATQFAGSDAAFAAAPMAGSARGGVFRRVKLGAFEVTTLFDGYVNANRVFPIFGQNQSADIVAAHMEQNFLPGNAMQNGYTPVLVNTGNELVLFDTGNGSGRGETRGKLLQALAEAGYKADQIDIVVITHFHGDHISGLITDGKPVFPNARYVTGEVENNFWTSKAVTESSDQRMQGRSKLVQAKVVPVAPKTTYIKGGQDVVTGITAVETFGHTPGHMAYNIESNGKRLLLWADACNHYVASLQKPEWHVVFDMDKDAAIASRRKILDMAAADRIAVTGYHMPFPAMGFIEKTGDAHRWVPLTYQFDL
ncbi:MAG: MBL fold metallo-hydrolase [Pseudomonadota bacterium]